MIFVSSSCIKAKLISEAVQQLADAGFHQIELSGGTAFYEGLADDLMRLQKTYKLTYLLHHYFPPPPQGFAINLASLDQDIYDRSIVQLKQSIDMSRQFNSRQFSFHAGAFWHVREKDLGQSMTSVQYFPRRECIDRFCEGYRTLHHYAAGLPLYVENHICTRASFEAASKQSPLMLVSFADFLELSAMIDFVPLLDVAHLNVSAQTLGLSFLDELDKFWPRTDYIHVGDVGVHGEEHVPLSEGSGILDALRVRLGQAKTVTLEVRGDVGEIRNSVRLLEQVMTCS